MLQLQGAACAALQLPGFQSMPCSSMDFCQIHQYEIAMPAAQKAAENGGERERRRHPPRCSLWRSARERAVWLHDVRASATAGDAHALAYTAAVYCDRCAALCKLQTKHQALM
jgi:hypothetical protein